MKMILAIAAGGAVGAVSRHFLAHQITALFGAGFPIGILACNVLGSFAMGAMVELMALAWSPSVEIRGFLTVGLLGAFTTFSTFSLDVVLLAERGEYVLAGVYIVASVVLSVAGLLAGLHLFRAVLA